MESYPYQATAHTITFTVWKATRMEHIPFLHLQTYITLICQFFYGRASTMGASIPTFVDTATVEAAMGSTARALALPLFRRVIQEQDITLAIGFSIKVTVALGTYFTY